MAKNKNIFLTFLIVTYRRPDKLKRLISQFLDPKWRKLDHLKLEIIIADDHGEDNTEEAISDVISQLKTVGWNVKYIYRKKNLRGDRNLYYGYTKDSKGKYVWFLCDDDILNIDASISFIKEVENRRPLLAICGFRQGVNKEISNNLGSNTREIYNFSDIVYWLAKFPKTTAYLYKRLPELNLDEIFERWDRTLYSWVGLGIYMAGIQKNSLLLYPKITAEADKEYLNLRYSYRIFGKLHTVIEDCINLLGYEIKQLKLRPDSLIYHDEFLLCLQGLIAHYSWRSKSCYSEDVLTSEKSFFITNFFNFFRKWTRFKAFLKLITVLIISKLRIICVIKDIILWQQNKA